MAFGSVMILKRVVLAEMDVGREVEEVDCESGKAVDFIGFI